MPKHIGQAATYSTILPNQAQLEKIQSHKLSKEAKWRLSILDFYYGKAQRNVNLTCRHFAVSRSFLFKWRGRWEKSHHSFASLESRSSRPKHVRAVSYDHSLVTLIRQLRIEYPEFSAVKLAVILLRDYAIKISSATIGRIIKRFKLFFLARRFNHFGKARRKTKRSERPKHRKPYGLKAKLPHTLVEFDMKHITNGNNRQYAFCAIDVVTKEAIVHIASTSSSQNAKVAILKVLARFGDQITILNDNGSENMGKVYDLLKEEAITQYFARPYEPKDKPHIENFIGKYQKECLDKSHGVYMTVAERQAEVNNWLNKWHTFRPHQALEYLTPSEFCAKLNLAIPSLVCAR